MTQAVADLKQRGHETHHMSRENDVFDIICNYRFDNIHMNDTFEVLKEKTCNSEVYTH